MPIARQCHCKHVSSATQADATVAELLAEKHATIQELLEVVFHMQSTLRLYTMDRNGTAEGR
jgi:hypothetical protein